MVLFKKLKLERANKKWQERIKEIRETQDFGMCSSEETAIACAKEFYFKDLLKYADEYTPDYFSYEEFNDWCNKRACDGCWGMLEAMACININSEMKRVPKKDRRKVWKEKYEKQVFDEIVSPTNKKIAEAYSNKQEINQDDGTA